MHFNFPTMDNDIEHVLNQHGIKPTANRITVLKLLSETSTPLTINEMEERLATIDKSNIFRVLNLFHDSHLVHIIEGGSEGTHYELCESHHDEHDDDLHPHFYCVKCHRTTCIDNVIPAVNLPEGYTFHSANYVIKGICPKCQHK